MWTRTIWESDKMTQFKDAYLSEDHSHMSVNVDKIQKRLCRGCSKVYPIKNDQNKILCAMDRGNDQRACKKET